MHVAGCVGRTSKRTYCRLTRPGGTISLQTLSGGTLLLCFVKRFPLVTKNVNKLASPCPKCEG
jgi:hypothetical protein